MMNSFAKFVSFLLVGSTFDGGPSSIVLHLPSCQYELDNLHKYFPPISVYLEVKIIDLEYPQLNVPLKHFTTVINGDPASNPTPILRDSKKVKIMLKWHEK